jgi:hypothetical protein
MDYVGPQVALIRRREQNFDLHIHGVSSLYVFLLVSIALALDIVGSGVLATATHNMESFDVACEAHSLEVACEAHSLEVACEAHSLEVACEAHSLEVAREAHGLEAAF